MKQNVRVLFVANVAKEHVLKFHVPMIKKLTDLGWTVDVACGGDEDIPYCSSQYKLAYTRATVNINTFKGFKQVIDIVKENEYDIIYCHTTVGGAAGRIASIFSKNKNVKVVFFDHGFDFCKDAPWYVWITFYPFEKIMAKLTDAIICINQEDYYNSKYRLKPKHRSYFIEGVGADFSKFDVDNKMVIRAQYRKNMNISDNATVLIYLAELTPNKNQRLLIDVLEVIRKKNPDTYLVLAGFDHCDGYYMKYAKSKGLDQYVRYLGWREDVGNLYAMSDICVASSIVEGLGLNLVEGMYSGLPVVATNNRGHSTVITDGETGFLVNQGDVLDFANKVSMLIENEHLKNSIVTKGLSECRKYSTDAVLEKLYSILLNYTPYPFIEY